MKPIAVLWLCLIFLGKLTAFPDTIPEERWKMVDQFLSENQSVSGFFLIGSNGRVRTEKGLGFADREKKIPFDDHTLFSIGSITKSFTATAIMILMERGLVHPEDPITRYFDHVPVDKQAITLHQLLTHSAGFPGAIGDDYDIITANEFQKKAWDTPLLFPPGTGYSYSNVGYSLLGMIVEKVSGESYSTFLDKNIFQPAGMTTSGYSNPHVDYTLLAHGYFQDGRDWGTAKDKRWDGDEPSWHLKANGGLLMSAMDLFRWYLALRNHTLLKPETLQLQTSALVKEGDMDSYYGYGFSVDQQGTVVQHNGGNRIFKADFRWFPKLDLFLCSVSNDANVRLFMLNDQIIDILMSGQLPEKVDWKTVSPETFPSTPEEVTARKFIDLLQQYSIAGRDHFIQEYLTAEIQERNDPEHLREIFDRLSQDIGQGAIEKIEIAGQALQLTLPSREEMANLRIKLMFEDGKIDRIGAEMASK
jgi:CubicO group peptidase (beta-lactamase class C family)